MTRKPVVPRERANRDVEEIIDYCLVEGAAGTAATFVAAYSRALEQISANPALGSPGYALELRIPGLRAWLVRRFPHLVFYVERESWVEVWRVLHARRDIPRWMQGSS